MTTPSPSANTSTSGGWFRVQDAVVARIADVGPLAIAVYVVLAKHADRDGCCWPSLSRLAALCGATRRGVQKAIARLVQATMIIKEKRANSHGGFTSNRYRVLPLTPQDPVEPKDPRVVNETTLPYGTTVHQGGEPKDPRVVNQMHFEPDPLNQTQLTRPIESEGEGAAPPAPPSLTLEVVVQKWNQVVGFCMVDEITKSRSASFNARVKKAAWVSRWEQALEKASKLPFCLGENPRGWRANLDWFLRPDTVTRLFEGFYDDSGKRNGQPRHDPVASGRCPKRPAPAV